MGTSSDPDRRGLAYGIAAYGFWGMVPLYFKAVASVPPLEVLAHRVVWSVLLLAGLVTLARRWSDVAGCVRPVVLLTLLASTGFIAVNWFVYVYGVATHQVLQTSLGYFINPLVNVVLGMIFFRERLRRGQWVAVSLAALGVIYLAFSAGAFPWIALTLAFSFALYGLLRKVVAVDSLIGLSVETMLLAPAALGFLIYLGVAHQGAFGSGDRTINLLLALSGLVTTVPLLCFGQAARRLPLSTLGFLQYLAPTLQFLLAVAVFREPFTAVQLGSFACIWAALVLFILDSVFAYRRRAERPLESVSLMDPD